MKGVSVPDLPGQHPETIPKAAGCHPDSVRDGENGSQDAVLQIAKFDEIFVKSDSKKIMQRNRPLAWVSLPTDFTSRGYHALLDGYDSVTAMAFYSVFMQLVKLSVQSDPYGKLQHSDGSAFSIGYIARTVGIDRDLVELAIAELVKINWLTPSSGQHPDSVGTTSRLQTVRTVQTIQDKGDEASPARDEKTALTKPTLSEWSEFGVEYAERKELTTTEDRLEESYDHYTANGWKQANGRPIKVWTAACQSSVRKHDKWSREAEDSKPKVDRFAVDPNWTYGEAQ